MARRRAPSTTPSPSPDLPGAGARAEELEGEALGTDDRDAVEHGDLPRGEVDHLVEVTSMVGSVPVMPRARVTCGRERSKPGSPHQAAAVPWEMKPPGPASSAATISFDALDTGAPRRRSSRGPSRSHSPRATQARSSLRDTPAARTSSRRTYPCCRPARSRSSVWSMPTILPTPCGTAARNPATAPNPRPHRSQTGPFPPRVRSTTNATRGHIGPIRTVPAAGSQHHRRNPRPCPPRSGGCGGRA